MSTDARRIVPFEDEAVQALGPIVALRPAFEIRVGALNLRERLELAAPGAQFSSLTRSSVRAGGLLPADDDCAGYRVNARLVAAVEDIASAIDRLDAGQALVRDDAVILSRGPVTQRLAAPNGLRLVERHWELPALNSTMLPIDAATLGRVGGVPRRIHGVGFAAGSPRESLLEQTSFASGRPEASEAIWIGPGPFLRGPRVDVRPGAVIDASTGPVILAAGVVVHPLSVVTGPAYLGPGTVVNPGAKLRQATSCGAFCKLGGEIEDSLILDLSNKQHDGFLGHAVVGSWVNLGADTNASDLKNNYSAVRVDLGDGPIDTGLTFVGPLLADHAKTGIDTMLGTGAVVGVAANVFGGGFVPRLVPAFSWGGSAGLSEYRLSEALATAQAVLARRDVSWTDEAADALRAEFEASAELRLRYGVK